VQQEIDVEAANVSTQVVARSMGWKVAHPVERGGVQSGASKQDPMADIHDCREILVGGHPFGHHCCCKSCVVRESMDVLGKVPPAHQKLATHCQG